jgi:hypothetical protein
VTLVLNETAETLVVVDDTSLVVEKVDVMVGVVVSILVEGSVIGSSVSNLIKIELRVTVVDNEVDLVTPVLMDVVGRLFEVANTEVDEKVIKLNTSTGSDEVVIITSVGEILERGETGGVSFSVRATVLTSGTGERVVTIISKESGDLVVLEEVILVVVDVKNDCMFFVVVDASVCLCTDMEEIADG